MVRVNKIKPMIFVIAAVLPLAGCSPDKPKCKVETRWDRHTAISITQALRWFPSDADTLKCMIPGSRLAFQVKASDVDLLIQRCVDECVNAKGDHHYPLPDTPRIRWDVSNGGSMQQTEGETVFYKLPTAAAGATLRYRIDTPGDKATDDEMITGTAKITTQVNADTSCLEVTITPQAPNRPTHGTEFQDSTAPICKPDPLVWSANNPIRGTVTVSNSLCPRSTVLLSSDFSDDDKLKLACNSDSCDKGEKEITFSDVLTPTWSDGGAGGSFPFGNTGKQVIYTVPNLPAGRNRIQIKFTVSVDDSGRQHNDPAVNQNQQKDNSQLFNLTAVNSTATGRFEKNITTGQNFRFEPAWTPANADVRKIQWETHLGGASGEIKRKQCSTRRMTTDNASLRFNNRRTNDRLNVSWRENSHQHGEKTLDKVQAWAQQCGDACFCDDFSWENSDFLTGNDKNKFKLYFDRDRDRDDGRVENLTTINADDSWGETTKLRGVNVPNWFVHWSSRTYAASVFNHAQNNPPLKYNNTRSGTWLGVYDRNTQQISFSRRVARQSDRTRFTGAGWFITSNDRHFDASQTQQRAYDLVGHKLASKVYLHEMAHHEAITVNWDTGGAWRNAYGPRRQRETQVNQWALGGAPPRITVTISAVGNYTGRRTHNVDARQKFDVTLQFNARTSSGTTTMRRTISNVWFTNPPGLSAADTRVQGVFEFYTQTERWQFRNAQLTQYRRANDPDDDFLPNQIEDQIGTIWNNARSHPGYARARPPTGVSARDYRADQEYWADHQVLGSGTPISGLSNAQWAAQVDPGQQDNDWANAGAQSDPPAQ